MIFACLHWELTSISGRDKLTQNNVKDLPGLGQECLPESPVDSVTEICGIAVPVFQAGMAGLSGPTLVAAVSEAGGLGHLGALRVLPQTLRDWIRQTREKTDKPFGVNLVPQFGGPEFFEAGLRVVLEEKPKVVSLYYGDFKNVIPRAKDAGIITMVQVGTVADAKKAVADGADIIIAQGIEGGGHLTQGRVGLMALLPAVVDIAGSRPVIAAGAVNDIRAVRAVRCLGALGVWCGTAFLASQECDAHNAYKEKLVNADTDMPKFLTGYSYGWRYGTPHRAIVGRGGWNLLRFMGGGIRTFDDGAMAEKLSLYAGQGVGQIDSIRPASDIVRDLAAGFAC
ncbi:enoyl-[acyl-carrier protein] reductase II [Roseovarius marisflavi]|uniref:Enoyl-[acyl-carrier protein] reductase II n=1 Tax=Roseovarius marisflavi TaxID=1054996 RepID=A0A1M7DIU1_9RHOB|nr:nitronate monooxygenase [Roseovarius marisflavi]SHL79392.1 enoyl-[acyl-carrier protein] reductase II [Roseovarius marisflavi]